MYAVKPLYPEISVRNLPTNMYEPKGYNLGSAPRTSGSPAQVILSGFIAFFFKLGMLMLNDDGDG